MKDSYVSNNIEQLLAANESQRNKIQFLERQRSKRDHYLSDLQQSLSLNKQTLRQYNMHGSNDVAIDKLVKETAVLADKLKSYYEEYQMINASLLMEQQMKLQDKQFYQERMAEFQNKIVDLRKYLHDKEDSFTSVVTRLKKYEDLSEPTIEEKLHMFKKEIGEKSINEYISDLIKQKNHYKHQYERTRKDFTIFNEMKNRIFNHYQQVKTIFQQYESKGLNMNNVLAGEKKGDKDKEKKSKKNQPNLELIRLLKKEKLNNQLLQEALADAIQKNQQLVTIKDTLLQSISKLESKCRLLHSENTMLALRIAQYDKHYCRRQLNNRKFYQQGDIKGLRDMTQKRVREYAESITKYYSSNKKLQQEYNMQLKQSIQKWSAYICDSWEVKKSLIKQNFLTKSSSTPSLVTDFELDQQQQKLIIEQF